MFFLSIICNEKSYRQKFGTKTFKIYVDLRYRYDILRLRNGDNANKEDYMKAERKKIVNGKTIEEFYWAGRLVVYVDNNLKNGTFDEISAKITHL